MSKKFIIMLLGVSFLSFGGAFAVGWFKADMVKGLLGGSQQAPAEGKQTADAEAAANPTALAGRSEYEAMRLMTKTQLKNLVYEVRDKVTQYEQKLQSLEQEEQRLQMTHEMVRRDIEKLNDLRVELTTTVATLKSERDKLEQTMVQISRVEKDNLITLAATYDKMQAQSASQILANMTKMPNSQNGFNDAVKILHYMTERTRGKLLAELAVFEPDLAALFCQKLKRVVEES